MKHSELCRKLPTKITLYHTLSKVYVLPSNDSHAVTSEYLESFIFKEPPFWAPLRNGFNFHNFRFQGKHRAFLLCYLEKLLKTGGKKPTGFSETMAPDINWLKESILNLEPEDKLKLLGQNFIDWCLPNMNQEEEDKTIEINPLYILYFFYYFLGLQMLSNQRHQNV